MTLRRDFLAFTAGAVAAKAVRATTREGMAARAHSLALWDAELMKEGTGDMGECLTYAIVRDLVTLVQEERA